MLPLSLAQLGMNQGLAWSKSDNTANLCKWAILGLFFIYFRDFLATVQFYIHINVKIDLSSIRWQDSNSWSPPIFTRPGLPSNAAKHRQQSIGAHFWACFSYTWWDCTWTDLNRMNCHLKGANLYLCASYHYKPRYNIGVLIMKALRVSLYWSPRTLLKVQEDKRIKRKDVFQSSSSWSWWCDPWLSLE